MGVATVEPSPVRLDAGTRATLHLLATHVLGRRRYDVSGRFGLRATPNGFGTPAFGEEPEVVRIAGVTLVHEVGAGTSRLPIAGSTLRHLASFVGADIDAEFSVGNETPVVEDPDAPLTLQPESTATLAQWYSLAWQVLDSFLDAVGPESEPATIQLWPEHFDAATTIALSGDEHVNVGFSPGDSFEDGPYAYVGPWSSRRPGDPGFWNAPFGAVLPASKVIGSSDPAGRCREFFLAGLRNFSTA